MRPPEAFGRPRPTSDNDTDVVMHPSGGGVHNAAGGFPSGIGGGSPAPMMTYFLADEADVDAALEQASTAGASAGRDLEALKNIGASGHNHANKLLQRQQQLQKHGSSSRAGRASVSMDASTATMASSYMTASSAEVSSSKGDSEIQQPDNDDDHEQYHEVTYGDPDDDLADSALNDTQVHARASPVPSTPPLSATSDYPAHGLPYHLTHAHTHSGVSGGSQGFSPLLSNPDTPSLYAMSGPTSLSAMSSPSSRRHSLSSSMLDDQLGDGNTTDASGDQSSQQLQQQHRQRSGSGRHAAAAVHGEFGGGLGGGIGGGFRVSPDGSFGGGFGAGFGGGFGGRFGSGSGAAHSGAAHSGTTGPSTLSDMDQITSSLLLATSALTGASGDPDSVMMQSGSAPQLIMPSIKMPSRRPFTETGKSMGRLKLMLAGDSGLGKTSLIKAIVQSCQHIVHVDHITPPGLSLATHGTDATRSDSHRRASAASAPAATGGDLRDARGRESARVRTRKKSRSARRDHATRQITEIYASTKPYPSWWSELDDGRIAKRRKSVGDTVLDRNICFVDTPGYTGSASTMDLMMPTVQYVETQLQQLCANSLSDADFVGLVTGEGCSSVDVVFYFISGDLKPADIEFIRLLTPLTNVIPLLARADTIRSEGRVIEAKERVAKQLHEAGIRPFVFSTPASTPEMALTATSASAMAAAMPQPYAVSSTPGSDHDTMDASLLMSPDYVQPLVPTELASLVEQVFCQDGFLRLRHAAARKLAQWRKSEFRRIDSSGNGLRPMSLYRPLTFGGVAGSPTTIGRPAGVLTSPLGAPSSFTLARLADHTQREEHLAQIRLATWAAELQRSLDNERARYESLARSERAVWLTERLSECVQDGTLVAVTSEKQKAGLFQSKDGKSRGNNRKKRSAWSSSTSISVMGSVSHEDPLGLLEVTADLQARAWLAMEMLCSLSVMGGLAFWATRHHFHLQAYDWIMNEWSRFWNMER